MFGLNLYIIAGLIALNAITFGLWRQSANKVGRIEAIAEIAKEETVRKIEAQEKITKETTNGWKAALVTTRRYYATQRLRNTRSSEMPAIPDATARVDAASSDPVPVAARVAEDCAVTTLTTNHLQDWISAQRAVR